MNNIYLITTAIQPNHTAAHAVNGRACVIATTELEAVAIALTGQPDETYILWLEIYYPQTLFILDRIAQAFGISAPLLSTLLANLTQTEPKS